MCFLTNCRFSYDGTVTIFISTQFRGSSITHRKLGSGKQEVQILLRAQT